MHCSFLFVLLEHLEYHHAMSGCGDVQGVVTETKAWHAAAMTHLKAQEPSEPTLLRLQSKLGDSSNARVGITLSTTMAASNGTLTYGTMSSTEQLRTGEADRGEDQLPRHVAPRPTVPRAVAAQLAGEVDTKACDWISVFACFLTGWTSAISFTVGSVRCQS